MTNEEFERKIEFIVEHQAQFASDIQQLREAHAQTEQVVSRLANVVDQGLSVMLEAFKDSNAKIDALVNSQIALAQAQARTDENLKNTDAKIDALVDAQIRLSEAQSRTDADLKDVGVKIEALTQAQARTDENLNRTDENLKRTDENLKRTDENLNRTDESLRNLIALVDRYLREGRNGESGR